MVAPTPGQIYLADQRGLQQTIQQQRYCTLNFADYQVADRTPISNLYACNEEYLAPGKFVTLPVGQPTHLLLVPLLGRLEFASTAGPAGTCDVEQVQVLTLAAGSSVVLRNPYEDELISFLHLWLVAETSAAPTSTAFAYHFEDLDNRLAELVPPAPQRRFALHLGRFQGRHEAVYQVSDPAHYLFAFVLAGAFELEGRLLHAQDGLALWQAGAVELEALSNDALVLLLELPG